MEIICDRPGCRTALTPGTTWRVLVSGHPQVTLCAECAETVVAVTAGTARLVLSVKGPGEGVRAMQHGTGCDCEQCRRVTMQPSGGHQAE